MYVKQDTLTEMDTLKDGAVSWPRPRIGWAVVFFVLMGTLLEFGSIGADDVLPSPNHVGNLLSLFSGIFMGLAGLLIIRRLSEDRVSRAIMIAAAGLFIFSKVLSCTVEYSQLQGVPVFGRDGFGHDILEDYTYTISLVMILFGFIRSALAANKARYDFGVQNEALKREVEQRSEVERALRASEALYRDLVDKTPDVVWRVDKTGLFTYASASFEEAFGILPDEIIGKHLTDVFSPEVAEATHGTIIQRMNGESGTDTQSFQFQFSGSDGQERIFESLSTSVWGSDGEVVEIQGITRDITGHVRAREALAASEEKYRSFVENNPIPIARIDREGQYVFVNQAFVELTGLSREAVYGKGAEILRDLVHPEDLEKIIEDARQALEVRDRRMREFRLLDGQGRWRWYVHMAYPWYEPDGRVGGVEAFARDITEQKLAGDAMRKSEQMARALLNATSDMAVLIDREGTMLAVNEHFASLFGETPAALEGRALLDLMHDEVVEERRKKCLTVLETGRPVRFSDERNGRHYEHCFYPVEDEQGAVTQLALYSRDVTESLRKEEERIRLAIAIEQAADSVIVTDPDGIVEYVNPGFERTTGYSRDEVVGGGTQFLRSKEHSEGFYASIERTISLGTVWSGRLVSCRKDGALFECDTTISPVQNEAGAIMNYVWLMHDVSTEVSLERQLRHAQKMEAVGTLAGGIAHDFNNILSLILGHSELLLSVLPDDEAARHNVRQIAKAGNRGAELVKQILTFSRQVQRRCEPCDVALIVKQSLRFLAGSLPATVEVEQNMAEGAGPVLADPIQLYQVVMNLCTNAYQAMETQGGILGLELEECDIGPDFQADAGEPEPGRYVRLAVSDTGEGMSETVAGHMFEPFYSTKKPSQGTGLGLSTVHGIVTSYGGAIRVRTRLGHGSVFEVFLPRMEAEAGIEPLPPDYAGVGSELVLFVDDDAELTQMAGMMLNQMGYRVTTFTNSVAAFEAFNAEPDRFDLAIVDQIMPHMMGVDLAKRMLQTRPGFPVFLLTGYSEGITPEQARAVGIREFIMKPFTSRELGVLIRKALDPSGARHN